MPSTDVDLSQYMDSIFIPFIYKFSTEHTPQVMCTIAGVDIEMPVDTGSTGLLIGSPILPNLSTIGKPAHHFFTSSSILYVGRLVELPVKFHGAAGSYATASVPVLVVDRSWRCPWYDPTQDKFDCPLGPHGEKAAERDTSNITYMGVGFGRNLLKDGMPYGTPSINPFLNVETINGLATSSASLRAGYMMSTEGVHLGVTSKNTQGFVFMDLEPGLSHAEDPRDWSMLTMCFSVNDEERSCGSGLIDIGIPQMYVRPAEGVSIPTVIIRNPNEHGYAETVKRVLPGTRITVGFPSLETPAASYSFIVGGGSVMEPSDVRPQDETLPPFVNTGRHFFFGYSVAFDAIGGRIGFHPMSAPSSSSVL